MFYPLDSLNIMVIGISIVFLLVGAVYLQAGMVELVKKEEAEEKKEKEEKEQAKEQKKLERNAPMKTKEPVKVTPEKKETAKPIAEKKETVKPIVEKKEPVKTAPVKQEPMKQEPVKSKKVNYEEKTLAELKVIAKEKNLQGISQLNKAALIEKLKQNK